MRPAIAALLAWLLARAREVGSALGSGPKPALRELAQGQDRTDALREDPPRAAQSKNTTSVEREVRILRGPEVDGGTAWTIRAPPGRDLELRDVVRRLIDDGQRWIDLPDRDGEVVTLALERGRARGEVVLHTDAVRLAVRRRAAEVSITAWAAEIEGVEVWYRRELPRAVWWLLGAEVEGGDGLADQLDELRDDDRRLVTQRAIQTAVDFQGLAIRSGMDRDLVSKAQTHATSLPGAEAPHSIRVSQASNPHHGELYDKPAKLAVDRGPTRVALIEDWTGEELGDPCSAEEALAELVERGGQILRWEDRRHGKALRLEGLDATHPGAALDRELLGALVADGLKKTWLVDEQAVEEWRRRHAAWRAAGEDGPEPRKRDCPEDPRWTQLREAVAGGEGPVRLHRAKVVRQHRAVLDFHLDRAVGEVAHVEALVEGKGDGSRAMARLAREVARAELWDAKMGAARARHEQMMRDLRERRDE